MATKKMKRSKSTRKNASMRDDGKRLKPGTLKKGGPKRKSSKRIGKNQSIAGRRIVVLFADDQSIPQTRGFSDKPGNWKDLREYGIQDLVPVFAEVEGLDHLEKLARRSSTDYPWPRFRNYFFLYLREPGSAPQVIRRLSRWRGVIRTAYEDLPTQNACTRSQALCGQPSGHLDQGPGGIGAAHAWKYIGGRGKGQFCVDVESSWCVGALGAPIKNHDRLAHLANRISLVAGAPQTGDRDLGHGTAVLGIICAIHNPPGCVGIAPDLKGLGLASRDSADGIENVMDAIRGGIEFLEQKKNSAGFGGGVLLLEDQTNDGFPIEKLPGVRHLVRLATESGITVVAAAGNGLTDARRDLDLAKGAIEEGSNQQGFVFMRPGNVPDSGAIIVGSSYSHTASGRHDRYPTSNFGSRVDCYAWGEHIKTPTWVPTMSPTYPGLLNECECFGETSGAAAIIAGAALVVQGIAAAAGISLAPSRLRDILSDPQYGTQCAAGDKIGSMPDLAKILATDRTGWSDALKARPRLLVPGPP